MLENGNGFSSTKLNYCFMEFCKQMGKVFWVILVEMKDGFTTEKLKMQGCSVSKCVGDS